MKTSSIENPAPHRHIVVDPVCEMDVRASEAPCISYSGRRTYYFCSPACKMEFDAEPEYFLDRISRKAIEARNRYGNGKSVGRRTGHRRKPRSRPLKSL